MNASKEFWAVEVKAGQSVIVDPDDQGTGYIHISQVALGEVKKKKDKASEPVVLYLKVVDLKFVIGTLTKDSIPQTTLNIVLDGESELFHSSKNASVHFSGFKIHSGDADDSDTSAQALKAANSEKPAELEEESECDFSESDIPIYKVDNFEEESESESEKTTFASESEEETPTKKMVKKGVHIATPRPESAAKDQTPISKKPATSKSGQQNKKSKLDRR